MFARVFVFGLSLLLASCAFSSEAPLFSDGEAVQPLADGARFIWRDSNEQETHDVTFRRTGAHYALNETGHAREADMDVMFVAVRSTPEDDYVAQVRLPNGDGVAYAFMWRVGEGYRAFASPSGFDNEGVAQQMSQFCEVRSYGECSFHNRGDVLAYYRRILYAGFVHGSSTPRSYIDLSPYAAGAAPLGDKPQK